MTRSFGGLLLLLAAGLVQAGGEPVLRASSTGPTIETQSTYLPTGVAQVVDTGNLIFNASLDSAVLNRKQDHEPGTLQDMTNFFERTTTVSSGFETEVARRTFWIEWASDNGEALIEESDTVDGDAVKEISFELGSDNFPQSALHAPDFIEFAHDPYPADPGMYLARLLVMENGQELTFDWFVDYDEVTGSISGRTFIGSESVDDLADRNITGARAEVTYFTAYEVGGSIDGLEGSGLVLIDTESGQTVVPDAGATEFAFAFEDEEPYNIEVQSPPNEPLQDCDISNASGTVDGAHIDNIDITCTRADEIFRDRLQNIPEPLINQF